MAEIPTEYHPATVEEFAAFLSACDSEEGWSVVHKSDDGKVQVWDQKSDKSSINIVKLHAVINIDAIILYDVLHDPEYRKTWDENMVEGFNIEQIDATNDVGYYSAKIGVGVSNRDFVNQRSWRVTDDREFIIMNHSVVHPKQPEKKGFVRANSIMTGYLIRVRPEGGCTLTYLTQTDPRGWIPTMLVNKVTKTFAPKMIDKLEKAAQKYNEWKAKNNPDHKPWRS